MASTFSASQFDDAHYQCSEDIHNQSTLANDQAGKGETGLTNQTNSCFANAVLQALLNTPLFASLYIQKLLAPYINADNHHGTRGILTGCISALFDCVWSGQYAAVHTACVLGIIAREVNRDFDGDQQEDAHEFQTMLLDRLSEDVNRVKMPRHFSQSFTNVRKIASHAVRYRQKQSRYSSSVVYDLFKIMTTTVNTCSNCAGTRIQFEEMSNLSIAIDCWGEKKEAKSQEGNEQHETEESTDDKRSSSENQQQIGEMSAVELLACLERHFAATATSTELDCPKCAGKREHEQMTRIWTLPDVLIIHLKRFAYEADGVTKNNTLVRFDPRELDMAPFLHDAAPKKGKSCSSTRYSLYAIVDHDGTASSGHYTARAKNLDRTENVWQKYDDARRPYTIDEENLVTNTVYMLYYVKNEVGKVITPEELCKKMHAES